MLTESDIKSIHGEDVIILFKGTEPFVEVEKGIPGGVLLGNSEGKVKCYVCGKFFEQLSTHLRSHKTTAKEYRQRFGYNRTTPLCSTAFSRKMSDVARESPTLEARMENMRAIGALKIGRPKGTYLTLQEKNRRDTCEEQVKRRLELLINKFGLDLSLREARTVDSGIAKIAMEKYGGWNEFKKAFGLNIDISSQKKNRADLIYELRKYVAEFHELPWTRRSQRKNCFPFSQMPYIREFGSIVKAQLICGVKRAPKNKFYLWN